MRSPLSPRFSPHSRRGTFTALAAVVLLVAGSLGFVASAGRAGAEPGPVAPLDLAVIDLHNDTAQAGSDCPDDGAAYWHFVFAPNDGSAAFVSITLNLTSETRTFSGAQIIPNGSQTDNVFVAVPAGHTLGDLQASGSFAAFTGATPNQFNLSHVCEGVVPTTPTTPTTETPTTETPTTETPTTETPTTPTSEVQPTVVTAEVLGTVQTAEEAAAAAPETLPYTGADTTGMLVSGLAVLLGGLLLVGLARARRGPAIEQ